MRVQPKIKKFVRDNISVNKADIADGLDRLYKAKIVYDKRENDLKELFRHISGTVSFALPAEPKNSLLLDILGKVFKQPIRAVEKQKLREGTIVDITNTGFALHDQSRQSQPRVDKSKSPHALVPTPAAKNNSVGFSNRVMPQDINSSIGQVNESDQQ